MGAVWRQLLGTVIGGACIFSTNCVTAQITPDRTLPNNSSVTINGSTFNITGGTQAGRNLFHSFQQFSVPTGGTASFNNGLDIQNIISRVTGGEASSIDGLIKANGTANLFFLNPNGIVFGKNASLNIGGSFVASTSNSIKFADGFEFSATAPSDAPLLTISVPIGLQYGANPRSITTNQSVLQVPSGNTLALVGGDVSLNSGELIAEGGRVELGGLTAAGTVGLQVNGNNLAISFPDNVTRADVSLSNGSNVEVTAGGGGSIAVNARNLDLTGGSVLQAGIGQGLGSVGSQAGDVNINATGSVTLADSFILNDVNSGAVGNAGDLTIKTGQLLVQGGAQVGANTFGAGKGGNLTVDASDVQLIGRSADSSKTSSALATQTNGIGDAGNLTINTGTLLLQDRAFIGTETFGAGKGGNLKIGTGTLLVQSGAAILSETFSAGKAGDLTVNATDTAQVIGTSADSDQVASRLSASALNGATGAAGNLTINTHQLLVKNGAQILAQTLGAGKGGILTVDASDVQLIGGSSVLSASAQPNSTGDAGDLGIKTNTLVVRDGAQVSAITFGAGKGGILTVDASDVQLIGGSSVLSASAQPNSTGDAGDLGIKTNTLVVRDGAQVSASTFGAGKGGILTVDASDVQLIGGSSVLSASAQPNSTGDAGDLGIKTNTLVVRDGAQVSASTFGAGKGGILTVDASDVQLIGRSADSSKTSSALATQTNGIGDAGNLTINTGTLLLQDRAFIGTETFGAGKGGNLKIGTGTLLVQSGAAILSETFSAGKAGDLTVNATDTAQVIGTSADSDQVASRLSASAFNIGAAGNLTINTHQLLVKNGAQVNAGTSGQGNAGNLEISTRSIRLDKGFIVSQANSGNGGNINLTAQDYLLLRNNSLISTTAGTANAGGNGGNITISTPFIIAFPLENSDITANAFSGSGGSVSINATNLFNIAPLSRQDLERLLGTNDPTKLDPQRLPTNDITAVSQQNADLSGTVQINTPDIDPSRGLIKLPTKVVDASNRLVSSSCAAFNELAGGSNFTITGRGGLPLSPDEPLTSDVVWTDTRLPTTTTQQHQHKTHAAKPKPQPIEIVPATGWVFNGKGEVTLISSAPNATAVNTPTSCPER